MKHHFIYILLLTLIWSCNQTVKKEEGNSEKQSQKKEAQNNNFVNLTSFDYKKFQIKRGQLGEIKIGMTIKEAEMKFGGLRKETGQATSFGFGGGGPAYLYYENIQVVFVLIPALNTDTILFIIVADPKLTTTNGVNPNSSVRELNKVYPDIKVNLDLMNGWEYIYDTINNWNFVFMTEEKTVGVYPELEVPSKLKNMDIKSDWITIQ